MGRSDLFPLRGGGNVRAGGRTAALRGRGDGLRVRGVGSAHSSLARCGLRRAGSHADAAAAGAADIARPLVFLPPVAINLGLAALFWRTLLRGREPLVTMFARMERGTLEVDISRYTRRLTGIWVGFFIGAAFLSAVLSAAASPVIWGWFVTIGNPLGVAALLPRRTYVPALALSAIPPRFTDSARAHCCGGLAAAIRLALIACGRFSRDIRPTARWRGAAPKS